MRKTISSMKKEILVPLLALLAVLLVTAAIFQPWWSVRTSPELQMITNSTMTIDAGLFQKLNVARTDANVTNTFSFGIANDTAYQDPIFQPISGNRADGDLTTKFTFGIINMTSYEEQTKQIGDATNSVLPLTVVGLALAIVTLLLVSVVTRKKMTLEKYTYAAGVLAVIVLMIAPLQLTLNVTNFWGSLSIPESSLVWSGEVVATWGPSIGWYLTLAAALLIIVVLLPVRTMYRDRKRLTQIQSLK